MVCDWKKCIDFINDQDTVSLDTRHMLVPDDSNGFWHSFCKQMSKAAKIKTIEFNEYPTTVMQYLNIFPPQLEVLKANFLK